MRKIVLSTLAVALIAASASQAFAAQKQHARKAPQTTNERFRDARNTITRPTQPAWPYSGWSAPAGR